MTANIEQKGKFWVFKATDNKGQMGFIVERQEQGKKKQILISLGITPETKKVYNRYMAGVYRDKLNREYPTLKVQLMDNEELMKVENEMTLFNMTKAADLREDVYLIGYKENNVQFWYHLDTVKKDYIPMNQREGAILWTFMQANEFLVQLNKDYPDQEFIMEKIQ